MYKDAYIFICTYSLILKKNGLIWPKQKKYESIFKSSVNTTVHYLLDGYVSIAKFI